MKVMYSSNRDDWATPQHFFDDLNKEFNFTLDPCCKPETAKCSTYFTIKDDGLAQDWSEHTVFMNPPYGRQIGKWVQKAHDEAQRGATVVCLIPARTDTNWFHDFIQDKAEIRFVRGRIYFEQSGGEVDRAPFPSMVVIFRGKKDGLFTVDELVQLFNEKGITKSPQMIRRWLREGKLKGERRSRKAGWLVPGSEVDRFLAEKNPLQTENEQLKAEIQRLKRELVQLKKQDRSSSFNVTPGNKKELELKENTAPPTRSPLIWFGGKSKVAQFIINRMPEHKAYVEPFGGAAHVIAQKHPVFSEVYNDIDGELVNFLMMVRDEPEKLRKACEVLPYSRDLYNQWKEAERPQDPFERAVRFYYLNRSAVAKGNGRKSKGTGWRHSAKVNPARAYHTALNLFESFAKRVRNVQIERRDFREIIRVYDSPDTLFYVDPPYIGREKYYAGDFTEQDHRDLAGLLNGIRGKAVISYYDDPLLKELYPDWKREIFQGTKQIVNGVNGVAEELLLMIFRTAWISLMLSRFHKRKRRSLERRLP